MLSRLSIRTKLLGGFGLVITLLCVLGAASLYATSSLSHSANQLAQNWLVSVRHLGAYAVALGQVRQTELALQLFDEPAQRAARLERLAPLLQSMQRSWSSYAALIDGPEERRLADDVRAQEAAYMPLHREVIALLAANDDAGALRAFSGARRQYDAFVAAVERLSQFNAEQAGLETAAVDRLSRAVSWSLVALMTLAIVVAVGIALMLGRSIAARIGHLAAAMGQLARRDYGFTLDEARDHDEIGELARAVDTCRDGLKAADELAARQREAERARGRAGEAHRRARRILRHRGERRAPHRRRRRDPAGRDGKVDGGHRQ
jgi:methyl-accepting chemotaxis protein